MRRAVLLVMVCLVAGCGGDGNDKTSAQDADVQEAVESKIRETVNLNALAQGTRAENLVVQCIPESDTKVSCIVSAFIGGQSVQVPWEGIIDPETGRFNVYSK